MIDRRFSRQLLDGTARELDLDVCAFVDQDGIRWDVRWCDAVSARERVEGDERVGQGLVFSNRAAVFHVPMRYKVDPLLLTNSQLNSMVERAFT